MAHVWKDEERRGSTIDSRLRVKANNMYCNKTILSRGTRRERTRPLFIAGRHTSLFIFFKNLRKIY